MEILKVQPLFESTYEAMRLEDTAKSYQSVLSWMWDVENVPIEDARDRKRVGGIVVFSITTLGRNKAVPGDYIVKRPATMEKPADLTVYSEEDFKKMFMVLE